MNNLIINQPFGLGDIIFLQGLVEKLRQDNNIIFPVADEYHWVQNYLERENVQFPRRSQYRMNYEDTSMRADYLPLRFSTQVLRGLAPHDYSHDHTVMEDKYTLMNEDYSTWRNFPIKRNYEKEQQLINELKLTNNDYTFVNENFGSNSVGKSSIDIDSVKGNIIKMSILDGYSIFDWIGVLEKCSSFYTVDTSIVWLIDYLQLKGSKTMIFRSSNTLGIKKILSPEWSIIQ